MEKKKFSCKAEEVPAIAGSVVDSLRRDQPDFLTYSPKFAIEFINKVEVKKNSCSEIVKAVILTGQMKAATLQLTDKAKTVRVKLNAVEGYLNLAGTKLDIQAKDFGLQTIRTNISNGNTEGIINHIPTLVSNIKRNLAVLQAEGMKPELVDELSLLAKEMDALNTTQSSKLSERMRLTDANIKELNELWEMLVPVFDAAKGMYKGVDEVKLKDYTISHLVKRVHTVSSNKTTATKTEGGSN